MKSTAIGISKSDVVSSTKQCQISNSRQQYPEFSNSSFSRTTKAQTDLPKRSYSSWSDQHKHVKGQLRIAAHFQQFFQNEINLKRKKEKSTIVEYGSNSHSLIIMTLSYIQIYQLFHSHTLPIFKYTPDHTIITVVLPHYNTAADCIVILPQSNLDTP